MNNRAAFAKAPNEWTQMEHNMCGCRAARSSLWWWPVFFQGFKDKSLLCKSLLMLGKLSFQQAQYSDAINMACQAQVRKSHFSKLLKVHWSQFYIAFYIYQYYLITRIPVLDNEHFFILKSFWAKSNSKFGYDAGKTQTNDGYWCLRSQYSWC